MKISTRKIVLIPLFTAIIAVCAWIHFPLPFSPVSVTLQLFGVFLALCCLGGMEGTVSILLYLILGAIGLPIFSGFSGGIASLFGITGGYLTGFLLTGLVYWLCETLIRPRKIGRIAGLFCGLIACYAAGTAWFAFVYAKGGSAIGILAILTKCVFPYVIPDLIKLVLAVRIARRIQKIEQTSKMR